MIDPSSLVKVEEGLQSRKIFFDPEVYELELERIFGRCWLFLGHESQIPAPGDFMSAYMGEDPVLVVRQSDGGIKALLNTCSHRGNRACYADSGNAKGFTCNYHGWTYGPDGALIFVPLEKECYGDRLDKPALGLKQVPHVDSYKGLIFGNFDPEAPSLRHYLGEIAWYLDVILDATPAGTEFLGPPMKNRIKCNWKLPPENFAGDGYHVGWTHAGALKARASTSIVGIAPGNTEIDLSQGLQVTMNMGHGFGWGTDGKSGFSLYDDPRPAFEYLEKTRPRVIDRLGEWRGGKFYGSNLNANIFPNFSFLGCGINTFRVWLPKGPDELEVWIWVLVEKDMPQHLKDTIRTESPRLFGMAGIFEPDDAENFEAATHLSRGFQTRQRYVRTDMGIGTEARHPELPGIVSPGIIGETPQRGFYRFWHALMSAENWSELAAG
ncbi:MAG TPA: aromatic ring-hydroxylating dioxygenase subunit alpha [Candidatus Binataceae bacterium]|nr:aromatic ring-hydroxylating dioxygenase subunit alpha [Candidatus Binataceae bacterium]